MSRFSFKFNLVLLMVFTAGNLLPPQVIITPLYRMYLLLPLPAPLSTTACGTTSTSGSSLIHIAFQLGFCTFVLSNYMKTMPKELTEAALVDGASVFRIYCRSSCRCAGPPLAALATLEFTFIYNDFFWALFLMKTGERAADHLGAQQPPGLSSSRINNLLAAGAIIVAVADASSSYFVLQRQFVRGLTLGSTKG